jgi:tetratricopeptide (TPR) repeat protein
MKSLIARSLVGACAVVLLGASSVPAAYVELADGSRRDGSAIRARSDGAIILTTPNGNVEFTRGQYTKAVADKPADFDKARQLAAQKNFDAALPLLDGIIQNYRFLDWDNNARVVKAQVLSAKGDAAGAVSVFDQLFQANPEAKKDSTILWSYYGAMVEAKQFDKMIPQLDELISKGSRADAAKAQIVRGDIKLSQANIEGAVLDYLRSAILYENEQASLPEALFKAADGLDKLRDPRAKDLYRRVASEFGGTPWGQKAAGK